MFFTDRRTEREKWRERIEMGEGGGGKDCLQAGACVLVGMLVVVLFVCATACFEIYVF